MPRIAVTAVAVVAGALLVGCAAPAPAPAAAPLPRSAPVEPASVQQSAPVWSEGQAETQLRAAFARGGLLAEGVDGEVAPLRFDAAKAVLVHRAGGEFEPVAGPGAWLFATQTGRFWVFENGVILPGD